MLDQSCFGSRVSTGTSYDSPVLLLQKKGVQEKGAQEKHWNPLDFATSFLPRNTPGVERVLAFGVAADTPQ